MPSPDVLAAYKSLDPELMTAAVDIAREQARALIREGERRMELEASALHRAYRDRWWSLTFGFLVAMGVLGLAAYMAHLGQAVVAGSIASIDIVALASLFIAGSRQKAKSEQLEAAQEPQEKGRHQSGAGAGCQYP